LGFRSLARQSGIASGTARHHLGILERQDLIWTQRRDQRLLHFPGPKPALELQRANQVRATLDFVDRAFLAYVDARGCVHQKMVLAAYCMMPRSTVQHRLKRLVRWGVLTETWMGRYKAYRIAKDDPAPLLVTRNDGAEAVA
jgi:predicted transcriptional regulator